MYFYQVWRSYCSNVAFPFVQRCIWKLSSSDVSGGSDHLDFWSQNRNLSCTENELNEWTWTSCNLSFSSCQIGADDFNFKLTYRQQRYVGIVTLTSDVIVNWKWLGWICLRWLKENISSGFTKVGITRCGNWWRHPFLPRKVINFF